MEDKWSTLNMYERNAFIKVAVHNGITDPSQIRKKYNEFANGGSLDGQEEGIIDGGTLKEVTVTPFSSFLNSLPEYQRDTTNYNVRRYWELNGKPKDFSEAISRGMYDKQGDGYHARSVAYDKSNDTYEFMKRKDHPTIKYELQWYYSQKPDAIQFRKRYTLDKSGDYYKYVPRKYEDGGEVHQLAEVVVTPRGNYTRYTGNETTPPTLQEYQEARARGFQVRAINQMVKQQAPIVPQIPSQNIISRGLGYLGMSDKTRISLFGTEDNPQTCINTATSMYGPYSRVSGNQTFAEDPSKYGFIPISMKDAQEGDLMQFDNKRGIPHHMTMITEFNSKGQPALSYSNGESTEWTIDENGKRVHSMKYDNDNWNPNWEQEEDYTSLHSIGTPHTYRYVGTKRDKSLWTKEYNKKYKKPKQ